MLKIFRTKNGISPLIATILLIAFAVALGSVLLQWGINLNLYKSTDVDKCNSVGIQIRGIDTSDACFGGAGTNGYIEFILDNTGTEEIDGIYILIEGDSGKKSIDLDNIVIKKGSLYEKKDKEVAYDFSAYGNIKQIQFMPKIKDNGNTETCAIRTVKAKKIGVCS